MKHFMENVSGRCALIVGICSLGMAGVALSQGEVPESAQALLAKVKQHDLDRQVAAKQTEIDRLAQDLAKEHKDAETLQQSLNTTGSMLTSSTEALAQLVNHKKRIEQVLELTALRIEAEKLKVDGLRLLAEAQTKTLNALTKRAEQTDVRATLGAAELKLLSETSPEPAGKGRSPLADLRKKLAISESAAATAERVARDAMRTASSRLEQADVASVKAKRKASGMEDLPAIAEKPDALDLKVPEAPQPAEKKP